MLSERRALECVVSHSDEVAFTEVDRSAMARAVACARLGAPSPNPHVGAVVVRDGVIVGEGFHARAGDAHAEVEALRVAGDRARGATVFVTLEPCNHHGRTPPCTGALLRAGVSRVVYAVADPNPKVAGRGADALRAAGVWVSQGFDHEAQREADRLLAPWVTFITQQRAHLTLKVATTLDGRIATRAGESRWITGPDARRDVHHLRAACDAVIVGSRTVLADDPELTARDVGAARQPLRVVIDSALAMPVDSKLATTARDVPVCVLTVEGCDAGRAAALRARGVEVVELPSVAGRVDLRAALSALAARGVVRAMCEGGGALHGAWIDRGLGDRVVWYLAPLLFGGAAPTAVGGAGIARIADARRLRDLRVERIGEDLRLEGEL